MAKGDKPTPLQKMAVDNVLSGKFKSKKKAMLDAGYSEESSRKPAVELAGRKGVQAYLKSLGGKAISKWGMAIEDKVMDTYMEGLDATKLAGKDAVEHPDWMARKAFADRFAEFFGWVQSSQNLGFGVGKIQNQQFNFFGVKDKDKEVFNTNFEKFLNQYYSKP